VTELQKIAFLKLAASNTVFYMLLAPLFPIPRTGLSCWVSEHIFNGKETKLF
jgi:hypothetical protein